VSLGGVAFSRDSPLGWSKTTVRGGGDRGSLKCQCDSIKKVSRTLPSNSQQRLAARTNKDHPNIIADEGRLVDGPRPSRELWRPRATCKTTSSCQLIKGGGAPAGGRQERREESVTREKKKAVQESNRGVENGNGQLTDRRRRHCGNIPVIKCHSRSSAPVLTFDEKRRKDHRQS